MIILVSVEIFPLIGIGIIIVIIIINLISIIITNILFCI
jgi:hypothetical protein